MTVHRPWVLGQAGDAATQSVHGGRGNKPKNHAGHTPIPSWRTVDGLPGQVKHVAKSCLVKLGASHGASSRRCDGAARRRVFVEGAVISRTAMVCASTTTSTAGSSCTNNDLSRPRRVLRQPVSVHRTTSGRSSRCSGRFMQQTGVGSYSLFVPLSHRRLSATCSSNISGSFAFCRLRFTF